MKQKIVKPKPSKVHIDYVKDAAVDIWIMSGNSKEDK